jgi:hypothetical protein
MLVKRNGARRTDASEVQAPALGEQCLVPGGKGDLLHLGLMSADVRQLAHVFG